jgi:hypothetical protein
MPIVATDTSLIIASYKGDYEKTDGNERDPDGKRPIFTLSIISHK